MAGGHGCGRDEGGHSREAAWGSPCIGLTACSMVQSPGEIKVGHALMLCNVRSSRLDPLLMVNTYNGRLEQVDTRHGDGILGLTNGAGADVLDPMMGTVKGKSGASHLCALEA